MSYKTRIIVKTSSDEQFIERVANIDPFEYFNRCIAKGIGSDFEMSLEPKQAVKIQITSLTKIQKTSRYTHRIQYDIETMTREVCDAYCTTIIAYFGGSNVISFQTF